jgi:hypothetical protein
MPDFSKDHHRYIVISGRPHGTQSGLANIGCPFLQAIIRALPYNQEAPSFVSEMILNDEPAADFPEYSQELGWFVSAFIGSS